MKVKIRKLLCLLFIAIFAYSAVSTVHAQSVTSTINVASVAGSAVYDSGKGEIFVTSSNTNSGVFAVSVISDSTNAVVATITVGVPGSMAYDSGKGEVFVSTQSGIDVISDDTNIVVATISVAANCMVYDSAKGEIFAFAYTGNTPGYGSASTAVSVISDSTNAVVATLTAGKSNTYVSGAAYDSGKGEVFVSNNVDNTVSVISDSSNSVVATVAVGNGPQPVAYDSAKGEVFVVNWGDQTISVISDSTNKVVATIKTAGDATPSYNFDSMAYVPSKGEMLLETFDTSNYNQNSISVISDSTNKVTSTINLGMYVSYPQSQAIAYDSSKNEVFMANGGAQSANANTVSVISLSSTSTAAPTATPVSSSSTFTTSSPTPKVPEFGNLALSLFALAIAAVTLSVVLLAKKKTRK
jgi:YVTN family beta-propeller protein